MNSLLLLTPLFLSVSVQASDLIHCQITQVSYDLRHGEVPVEGDTVTLDLDRLAGMSEMTFNHDQSLYLFPLQGALTDVTTEDGKKNDERHLRYFANIGNNPCVKQTRETLFQVVNASSATPQVDLVEIESLIISKRWVKSKEDVLHLECTR